MRTPPDCPDHNAVNPPEQPPDVGEAQDQLASVDEALEGLGVLDKRLYNLLFINTKDWKRNIRNSVTLDKTLLLLRADLENWKGKLLAFLEE